MKKISVLFLLLFVCSMVNANVTLPKIFGDDMVLQRNKPVRVWGWASANEKVTVKFNQQTKTTKADKSGNWQLILAPEVAGGPFELSVKGKNQIVLKDILVGEVWICSGQSNMEMPIEGWGKINHFEQEIAAADYPQIRHFKVPNTVSTTLKDDVAGGDWKVCSPENVGDFSATAYFFARELYRELKIPVGLINTSWGGTQSEAWTSKKAFAGTEEFKDIAAKMTSGDIEIVLKDRQKAIEDKLQKIQGGLDKNPETNLWKTMDFNDSKWPKMKLPGTWEEQGLENVDGTVWLRKTIEISDAEAGLSAMLELAMIDDIDETYVNGVKVGETNIYNSPRNYSIPSGIIKAGKNVIAVKVIDTGGGGGIYGDAANMKLSIGKKVLSLSGDWIFRIESLKDAGNSVGPNDYPSLLFNAMLNPLLPFTIEGAIWYQGESNAGRAFQYRKAFPLMITDWRRHFNQGDFPFYFVQLSTFGSDQANSNNGSTWAELREAQTLTLSLPNTGMAVTTDIGNPKDIHPKNKQDVGKRLAKIALHDVYEKPGEYTGPVYQGMKKDGNKIEISFTHLGSGLLAKDKYGYLKGFEIAGTDQKFVFAKAWISEDKVIVSSESLADPVAVRYNWADDASEGNLFNQEQFPAAPFRTDDWECVTKNAKYSF
ncbi:MAG: sialate O-acetylesterase [Prolixibacteraceae bacterium]